MARQLPRQQHVAHTVHVPSTNAAIRVRPFTGREEKMLLTAQEAHEESESLAAVVQVVKNCILSEKFDPSSLTTYDVDWLFVKLRTLSVDTTTTVVVTDPQGVPHDVEVDLTKVFVDIPPLRVGTRTDEVNGIEVVLRDPPASFYEDLEAQALPAPEKREALLAACVAKVRKGDEVWESSEYTNAELRDFIQDLDSKSREYLASWLDGIPTLEYSLTYTTSAGEEKEIVMSRLSDFFSLA